MKIKIGDDCLYLFSKDRHFYWINRAQNREEYEDGNYGWGGDITDLPTKISALRSEIIKELFAK